MFPFVRCWYVKLDVDQKKVLCSTSYKIVASLWPWSVGAKQKVLGLLNQVMSSHAFIYTDVATTYKEIESCNPVTTVPGSAIDFIKCYFSQFYVIRNQKLCLPSLQESVPKIPENAMQIISQNRQESVSSKKVVPISEETWWVIRVKNDYRMCRLTYDRGDIWEMIEYQNGKISNPHYKFPKYDNRVIYEFKEHITPSMFQDKIEFAVQTRKAALLKQAHELLLRFDTVIIARHLTGGTLVGGVEEEDDSNWYLDTYNEHGEHIFYGDDRWNLSKKSRCTVVEILRRK